MDPTNPAPSLSTSTRRVRHPQRHEGYIAHHPRSRASMPWRRRENEEDMAASSMQRERERRAAAAGNDNLRAWPTICYSPEDMLSALNSMELQSLQPPPALTTHVPLYERRAGRRPLPAEIITHVQPPVLSPTIGPFRTRPYTTTFSESESDDSETA